MKNYLITLLFFLLTLDSALGQILKEERLVDWSTAGVRDTTTKNFEVIKIGTSDLVGDGVTPNDSFFLEILLNAPQSGAVFILPEGTYLFKKSLRLPSNTVLRGAGKKTVLVFDLNGKGNSIEIIGEVEKSDIFPLQINSFKGSFDLFLGNFHNFKKGDWIKITQEDSLLVTSSWAKNTVGQIAQIMEVHPEKLTLYSALRLDYLVSKDITIRKLNPKNNVGIECLTLVRNDQTDPQQSSTIKLEYAVNCWIKGVISEFCTFSHIDMQNSSNNVVANSYFNRGFSYGANGRAYGVMLQSTSNECLIENNIFEFLRHSMIVQSGANCNVFAYNYSLDPYWNSQPSDAAGDIVLHGNFAYANLFEQNICQNIVIDNSHGPNGPNNTFFRNRAQKFGIFFSANNSPNQNIIANEITNNNFPYNLVNFTILGEGHFLYANNNKGKLPLQDTSTLLPKSLYYSAKPLFLAPDQWSNIGFPNVYNSKIISAVERHTTKNYTDSCCVNNKKKTSNSIAVFDGSVGRIYPNPFSDFIKINDLGGGSFIEVFDFKGTIIHKSEKVKGEYDLDTRNWAGGTYILRVTNISRKSAHLIIKENNCTPN